jgi:hypothetical protein
VWGLSLDQEYSSRCRGQSSHTENRNAQPPSHLRSSLWRPTQINIATIFSGPRQWARLIMNDQGAVQSRSRLRLYNSHHHWGVEVDTLWLTAYFSSDRSPLAPHPRDKPRPLWSSGNIAWNLRTSGVWHESFLQGLSITEDIWSWYRYCRLCRPGKPSCIPQLSREPKRGTRGDQTTAEFIIRSFTDKLQPGTHCWPTALCQYILR